MIMAVKIDFDLIVIKLDIKIAKTGPRKNIKPRRRIQRTRRKREQRQRRHGQDRSRLLKSLLIHKSHPPKNSNPQNPYHNQYSSHIENVKNSSNMNRCNVIVENRLEPFYRRLILYKWGRRWTQIWSEHSVSVAVTAWTIWSRVSVPNAAGSLTPATRRRLRRRREQPTGFVGNNALCCMRDCLCRLNSSLRF